MFHRITYHKICGCGYETMTKNESWTRKLIFLFEDGTGFRAQEGMFNFISTSRRDNNPWYYIPQDAKLNGY